MSNTDQHNCTSHIMESNSNMQDIDQMRQQMALLKQRLDRQLVVSDKLMRQSMKGKMQWIKRMVWFEIIIAPFLIVFFALMATRLGLSMGPVVMLALMLAVSVTADYVINIKRAPDFMAGTLVETQKRLLSMKRLRMWAFAVELPLCLVWAAWLIADMYLHLPAGSALAGAHSSALAGGIVGGCIGFVAGLAAAVFTVRKMQKTNDAILSQIKDLTAE